MANEQSPDTQSLGASPRLGSTVAEVVDREMKAPDGTILWANQTELDLLGY
jgi:hypothetical protein